MLEAIADREKRLGALEARITALETAPSIVDLVVRRIEKEARARLQEFRGLMKRHPDEARGESTPPSRAP